MFFFVREKQHQKGKIVTTLAALSEKVDNLTSAQAREILKKGGYVDSSKSKFKLSSANSAVKQLSKKLTQDQKREVISQFYSRISKSWNTHFPTIRLISV